MIDGLISGKIHGKPVQRTGKSGKAFVTSQVRAATGNGENLFVSVIAFDEQPKESLLALDDGEAVSLAGELTPKVWQPRNGGEARPTLDMIAHAVLSAYHITRKRKASEAPRHPPGANQQAFKAAAMAQRIGDDFEGDLPWE